MSRYSDWTHSDIEGIQKELELINLFWMNINITPTKDIIIFRMAFVGAERFSPHFKKNGEVGSFSTNQLFDVSFERSTYQRSNYT